MYPVLMLMAGGAMVAGGVSLMSEGRRKMALREAREVRLAEIEALEDAEKIQELRRRVSEAGGDPDAAVAAVRALNSGTLTLGAIERYLLNGGS